MIPWLAWGPDVPKPYKHGFPQPQEQATPRSPQQQSLFNAVIEGSLSGVTEAQISRYKFVHLAIPRPITHILDSARTFSLYARTDDFNSSTIIPEPAIDQTFTLEKTLAAQDGLVMPPQSDEEYVRLDCPRTIVLSDGRVYVDRTLFQNSEYLAHIPLVIRTAGAHLLNPDLRQLVHEYLTRDRENPS